MRGYFEDEESEREERQLDKDQRDKELTLGWGAILGLLLGLVVICGLCFSAGYAVGHRSSAPPPAAAAQPPAAPDQEPLQANASIPKPEAAEQAPVAPLTNSNNNQQAPSDSGAGANPVPAQANLVPGAQVIAPANPPPNATPNQPQVRPALGAYGNGPGQSSQAPAVHAALPLTSQYAVQIAAVANSVDANVLTNALRKRNYPVTERRDPVDGLIHVRVGPFASHDEANRWRAKLQDDGYNAVIEP
jgi:cell division septation protein DedD